MAAKLVAPIFEPEVPAYANFFAETYKRREVWVFFPLPSDTFSWVAGVQRR